MKRTALERRTPLKAKTGLKRGGYIRPKPTRKPKPSREFWQAQREALFARNHGRCEHCGRDLSDAGLEAHHRKLRSQGGGHSLVNLAALCPESHRWAHAHPLEAQALGFIVPREGHSHHRPMTLHSGRIVRLTLEGGYDTCFTEDGEATA